AAVNRAKVDLGDRVAVFGIGGIGLNVIQGAAVKGAKQIVAVDTVADKEAVARQFGATDFVRAGGVGGDADAPDVVKTIKKLTGGGVDHAFECVGHPAVFRDAVAALDWGGQCVILGVPKLGTEASFVVADLYNDKSILGCRYGTSRPRHDIPVIVDLYLAGKIKLDELITKTVPLDDVEGLIDDLSAGRLARGVMTV
ncbi:MAG TPA: zinc-binding dehydrogenase, partial [Acidimicrobiia bacterium]|nr:zinc-binding dehydrogenase [Acidimicrobiia bacterium]